MVYKKESEKGNENNGENPLNVKSRQREFLEERMSTIRPKEDAEMPAHALKASDFTESSVLKENFRQKAVKQYRELQKQQMDSEDG